MIFHLKFISNKPTTTFQRSSYRFLRVGLRWLHSDAYTIVPNSSLEAIEGTSALNSSQRTCLDKALRVDHAGEIAANYIYRGQMMVCGGDKVLRPVIQSMWDQEKRHLQVMNKLMVQHRIRPTILSDLAKAAGFTLGITTALLGKEAAMACTEAVEIVIGEHYDDQLGKLKSLPIGYSGMAAMKNVIKELRDDEFEHLNIAIHNHSQRAPAHALLSAVIGIGCEAAIHICKRL